MTTILKELFVGFTVSVFATGCGIFLYLQYISKYGFEETIQMIEDGEDCFGVRNDLFLTSGAASKGTGLDYCPSAVYLKLDIQP